MKIIDKFVVYQGKEPALFPGLTRAANGDLLVSFCTRFDCIPGGEAYLLRSSDEGRTWTPPVRVLRSSKPDGCINLSVGMTTLRDGAILYPCCDARITRKWDQHDADLIILRSDDHGHTWSEPRVHAVGVKEPFAYGRIIERPTGELICPVWGKQAPDEPWRSGLVRSKDGGKTWGEHVTVAYDPKAIGSSPPVPSTAQGEGNFHSAGFNETTLLDLPDGRFLAVIRQQGVEGRKRDLYQSVSDNGGWHWPEPERIPLWGTSPSLHLGPRGLVLLGYRNHLGNPQGLTSPGVGLSVSPDGGKTYPTHILLEDPKDYRYDREFDAGYPAFLSLDQNRVMVLFYSYDPASQSERYLAANILAVKES